MNTHLRHLAVAAIVLMGSSSLALADPPGRVGRLSAVEGAVSLHQPDQPDWSLAGLNYPVIAGDAVWTAQSSRSEIQIGPAELRMDELSELDILRLDEGGAQVRVDQGVVNVHLMVEPPGGMQIITPEGQVDIARPGRYHIDVGRPVPGAPPAPLQVTVLEGEARLSTARAATAIPAGQGAVVPPDQSGLSFVTATMTPFDAWAMDRERYETASQTVQYVSPEMTGFQDLDRYGSWTSSPDYGAMWIPEAVGADWAPYRFGHWAYVAPWGWTWIDDAPWGFAPFHYGRWVHWEGRWAWCPGHPAERPVYAPALVAFIGSPGAGVGITVGQGPAVGWVPLAPHEVFHPYYQASETYVRNVNVSHVTNVTQITTVSNVTVNNYANHQAATVVPNSAFTGAAPIHQAALRVAPDQFAHAPVAESLGHLQPTPAALHSFGTPPGNAGPQPQGQGPGAMTPAAMPQQPHPQGQPQPAAPVQMQAPMHPQGQAPGQWQQQQPQAATPAQMQAPMHPQGQPSNPWQQQQQQPQHQPQPAQMQVHPQGQPQMPQMQHPAMQPAQPAPQMQPHPNTQPPHEAPHDNRERDKQHEHDDHHHEGEERH